MPKVSVVPHNELPAETATTESLPVAPPDVPTGADVEFMTPGGKRVKLGKPTVPTALFLPTLMAAAEPSVMSAYTTENLIRRVLYVREINGKPVPSVQRYEDIHAIALQLGEDGMEALEVIFAKYFPPLSEKNIQIIKK